LGICAIFKNEAPYLLEWLAFHTAAGVAHFVLYDNGSTDGGAAVVRASWFASRVTLVDWPQRPGQLPAYRDFLANHRVRFAGMGIGWVAFIDLDEFLLPLSDASVPALLSRMGHFSAVLVAWLVFGPSGHDTRPNGLVIEAYDKRAADDAPVNQHIKSIVRCSDMLDVTLNPHEFFLRGPTCDPLGHPVPNIAIQPEACHQGLVLNHYQTRSRAEWETKVARGNAMFEDEEPAYPPDLIDHYADLCRTEDRTIMDWAPRVRSLLFDRPPPPPVSFAVRDHSRPGSPWYAALRDSTDPFGAPAVLRDAAGLPLEFATEADARAACRAALRPG
jgi:hypothetical protein